MTNKHTKGPWKTQFFREEYQVRAKMNGDAGSGVLIAQTINEWITQSEAEANAHLIAAAPELLEALISLKEMVEVMGDVSLLLCTEIAIAANAIKKARGEA